MFNIAAFNRLLRQRRQAEKTILQADESGLSTKQISAGLRALRLLKLADSLESLKRNDLMNFLYAMGMNPTPDVLDGKLRQLRLHREELFTWGELAHVWALLMRDVVEEDDVLERAFAFFDKDSNGEISVAELRTTMHELGDLLSEEEIQAFMAVMDTDGSGMIGYAEFLETLRTEAPEFAGKAMRATSEDGSSCSSSTPSQAGSPGHSGCRQQFRAAGAAVATPRQGVKSWLSPRSATAAAAQQPSCFGVHRSSARLEDFEPATNLESCPRQRVEHQHQQQDQHQ